MSTERDGLFYSIWPVLGKRLNWQWGYQRQNTSENKAVVRSTVLDVEDGEDILNARKDVKGRYLGEADFQKKWRTYYSSDDDQWKLQRNSGTQAVPVWETVLSFDDDTGAGEHTGPSFTFAGTVFADGGFSTDGGFYGINHPQELERVMEWPSQGTEITDVTSLLLNDEHFYVTPAVGGTYDGQPVVNLLNKDFGRAKVFNASGIEWQINHNFNTSPVMATVYDIHDHIITPSNIRSIDVSDPNIAYFYFDTAFTGKTLIASGGVGAVEILPRLTVTDDVNSYQNVDTLKFQAQQFYIDSDATGSPIVNIYDIPLTVSDGDNVYGNEVGENLNKIILNQDHFYLSSDSDGKPVVNIEGLPSGIVLNTDGADSWVAKNDTNLGHGTDVIEFIGTGSIITEFKFTNDATGNPLISEGDTPRSLSFIVNSFNGQAFIEFNDDDHSKIHVNSNKRDVDFIASGRTDTHLLSVNANRDKVGIGLGDQNIQHKLHVDGDIFSEDKIVGDGFYLHRGGELISNAINVGGGTGEVFAQKSEDDLQFKTITGSGGIVITNNATTIDVDGSGVAGGSGGGGGFYGVIFKESEAGGAVYRDDTLVFDSDYFYLVDAGDDAKPLLSFDSSPVFDEVYLREFTGGDEGIGEFLQETVNKGVLHSFTVTDAGGLNISWTDSEIWNATTGTVLVTVAGSDACTDDAINYLYYDRSGGGNALTLSTTAPDDSDNDVRFATIYCQDGDIWGISQAETLKTRETEMSSMLRNAFPSIVTSGLIVSAHVGGGAWDVDMSSGTYWLRGHERNNISAIDSTVTNLVRWFHDGGGNWDYDINAQIDTTQYDTGAGLAAVTANKYYRSTFFLAGSTLHWIYPRVAYDTVAQAIAGPNVTKPNGLEHYPRLTSVVLRGNAAAFPASTSDQWIDVRPIIGVPGGAGDISDHGELAGLSDDDHTQYALVNGTRAFTGEVTIDAGGADITGDVDVAGDLNVIGPIVSSGAASKIVADGFYGGYADFDNTVTLNDLRSNSNNVINVKGIVRFDSSKSSAIQWDGLTQSIDSDGIDLDIYAAGSIDLNIMGVETVSVGSTGVSILPNGISPQLNSLAVIDLAGDITQNSDIFFNFVSWDGTLNVGVNKSVLFGNDWFVNMAPTINLNKNTTHNNFSGGFIYRPTITTIAGGAVQWGSGGFGTIIGSIVAPAFQPDATSPLTVERVQNYVSGSSLIGGVDTDATVEEYRHYSIIDPNSGVITGGTINNQCGIYLDDLDSATINTGIESIMTSGVNKKFINHTGDAESYHAGNFYIAADLTVTGKTKTFKAVSHEYELNGNTKDLTMDWDESNVFFLPIRRPMTIHTPANLPTATDEAQIVQLVTKNDGFYSFVWSSKYLFPGGGQLTPSQGENKIDLWSLMYMPVLDRILVTKAADMFY